MGLGGGLLVAGVLFLVTWFLLYWLLDVRRMARVSASIPGPQPLPIVGNFFDVLRDMCRVKNSFQSLLKQHGYTLRLWFGPVLVVFVLDAKDAEVVFQDQECATKPWLVYRLVEPGIGRGMVNINGADHRRHRKLILPSLHKDMLVEFFPYMRLAIDDLVSSFKPFAASAEVFNVKPLCGMAALSSTYLTILNADSDILESTLERRQYVVDCVDRFSALLMYRILRPWYHLDWVFRWNSRYKEYRQHTHLYDNLIMDVLEHKLEQRRRGEAPPPRKRLAFLDHVLASEGSRSITKDELYHELKTMTAAGLVTSMDGISMMLTLLSIMPDVQARIHKELDDIFDGDSSREVEVTDLEHMEYIERFIKESLRYYPPFPSLARRCSRDIKLPSGHTVPKGAFVGLSPLAMHWNPDYFPEPARFDPDRFLPEVARTRNPVAWVPFSAGPRNCIGSRYAMMFLKTCLASLLRAYDVLPNPDGPKHITKIRMEMGVTYFPRDGARVCVRPRQAAMPAGG